MVVVCIKRRGSIRECLSSARRHKFHASPALEKHWYYDLNFFSKCFPFRPPISRTNKQNSSLDESKNSAECAQPKRSDRKLSIMGDKNNEPPHRRGVIKLEWDERAKRMKEIKFSIITEIKWRYIALMIQTCCHIFKNEPFFKILSTI